MLDPATSDGARSNILIVDDSVEHLLMLHGLVRHEYATTVAANGLHGLELASASPTPDIVLLDVHMPDLNGYDLCRRLKAHPETARIPVIDLRTACSCAEDYSAEGLLSRIGVTKVAGLIRKALQQGKHGPDSIGIFNL